MGMNGDLERLEGMQVEDGKTIHILPAHAINLQIELMAFHRECLEEVRTIMQGDNYSPEAFYGAVAAYCGIVLDGTYGHEYLAEMLWKELMKKRGVEYIDTGKVVTISKELLQ